MAPQRVDAYATMSHWSEHVRSLWGCLDPEWQGTFYSGSPAHPPRSDRPILVSSWRDASRCLRVARKVILMEHGAGQHFTDYQNPSYSGSIEHRALALRLVPNEYCAAPHRANNPKVPVEVIGSPKLDSMVRLPRPASGPVALSNHWDGGTAIPEMGSAWFAWHSYYRAVPEAFGHALGHGHPKLWPQIQTTIERLGFDPTPHFSDVARRAGVYVSDGMSTLFEFAALDRPVVVLNPPHFRRDVNHGGRFWDWADVGVQVWDPNEICDAITEARKELPSQVARRREIVAEVYPHLGSSGARGAQAIQAHFG